MNVPEDDEPAPESLQILREYAERLALLKNYEVITIFNHEDIELLAAFIKLHDWRGTVEVESRHSTVRLLASAEFFCLGVECVIIELGDDDDNGDNDQ